MTKGNKQKHHGFGDYFPGPKSARVLSGVTGTLSVVGHESYNHYGREGKYSTLTVYDVWSKSVMHIIYDHRLISHEQVIIEAREQWRIWDKRPMF